MLVSIDTAENEFEKNLNAVNNKNRRMTSNLARQSYQAFKMHDTRQRGLSHRYSMHQGKEFGALDDTNADIEFMWSQERRKKQARWSLVWVIIYAGLIAYIISIMVLFSGIASDSCVRDLIRWLVVYAIISALQIIRGVANVAITLKAKNPSNTSIKMEFFYGYWVALLEIGWTFYGNFIIFNDKLERSCSDSDIQSGIFSAEGLWISCLIIIIYGYIMLLSLCFICLVGVGIVVVKTSWDKAEESA